MKEIWINTPRGRIFGMTAGKEYDPLIIGLHGWSQRNGWHTWEPVIEPLAAAGYRVISVDMPGWGQSPAWEKTAGKSAVVAMLDALEIKQAAALMGKSWGGGVALDLALSFPERVEKLILTAPAFRGSPADLQRLTQAVLMAWAEDDPVIPIAVGRQLIRSIPNGKLITYATGGHSAAPENADDFAPKAINFLKS
ncbi:MAG: alpha/beta fold hydrolase [Ardenticatenaceae bacterium]|nr:alpha/beta fold hydrolase [Ardenticatenaceae bacterium]